MYTYVKYTVITRIISEVKHDDTMYQVSVSKQNLRENLTSLEVLVSHFKDLKDFESDFLKRVTVPNRTKLGKRM